MRTAIVALGILILVPSASAVAIEPGRPADVDVGEDATWTREGSFQALFAGVGGSAEYRMENGHGTVGEGGGSLRAIAIRGPDDPELVVDRGTLRILLAQPTNAPILPNGTQTIAVSGSLEAGECRAFAFSPSTHPNDLPSPYARWDRTIDARGGPAILWREVTRPLELLAPSRAIGSRELVDQSIDALQVCTSAHGEPYSLEVRFERAEDAPAPSPAPVPLGAAVAACALVVAAITARGR